MSDAYSGVGPDYDLVPVEHDPFADVGASMARHLTGNPAAGLGSNPAQAFLDWRNSGQSWADQYHDYSQRAQAGPQAALEAAGNPMDLFGGFVGQTVDMPGFHGSPVTDLRTIKAAPPTRQFDNATSQFGAFFAPNADVAQRYAGATGRVYRTDLSLSNPYEMPISEFTYFQSPHKGPEGDALPGEQWAARADALKQEAATYRDQLTVAGHDGLVVRNSKGEPIEIASFRDVNLPPSITAYHGSPYDFSKFDLSKIGTGEGAQAYGHGLYFAENEGTANSYRETLGNRQGHISYANNLLNRTDQDVDKAIALAKSPQFSTTGEGRVFGPEAIHYLERMKAGIPPERQGKMYQVSIAADPEHFLDWDKPLSEQSEHVQSALQQATSSQGLNHALARDAQSLSGLVQGQSFLDKGYGGLDAPSRRIMLKSMVSMVNDPEIRQSVVGLVPVDVMNVLSGQKAATEGGLHNASVLFDKLSKVGGSSVPLGVDSASSSIAAIANAAAKKFGVQGDIVGRPVKGLAALPAGQDHLGSDIYRALGGDENAANTLKSQGVSGIKYLDQGSRGPVDQIVRPDDQAYAKFKNQWDDLVAQRRAALGPREMGDTSAVDAKMDALHKQMVDDTIARNPNAGRTHNYVVFDDKLIDIIKKYGIAGLIAGGASHFSTQQVNHDPFASGMAQGGRVGRKARVAAILQRHGIAA